MESPPLLPERKIKLNLLANKSQTSRHAAQPCPCPVGQEADFATERSPVGQGCGSQLGAAPTPPQWGNPGKSKGKVLGKEAETPRGAQHCERASATGRRGRWRPSPLHPLSVPHPSPAQKGGGPQAETYNLGQAEAGGLEQEPELEKRGAAGHGEGGRHRAAVASSRRAQVWQQPRLHSRTPEEEGAH